MAKDSGTAPAPRPAARVRNVALVGHAGAGKTTLAEALLVAAGALPRAGRVEDGTTALDTEEVEIRQQRSVSLGVATVEHAGHRITLLDTPGSPDFVGELRAGLRAADAALFVVSAVGGVDATTVQLWEECAAVGMPRAVVVTQLDRARADVEETVRLCQTMLGTGVYPVHLVDRGPDGSVSGVVNLLQPGAEAPDADRLKGVGLDSLLYLLVNGFPCPMEHGCPPVTRPDGRPAPPLSCDPDGPLVAEVVKTTTDPYLGRVSLVRVFSGTLRPDTPVHVSGHGMADRGHPDHDVDERIGAVSSPLGATLRPVAACPAGDICAVARLASAETGDTLSSPEDPRLVPPWDLPTPQLPVAVEASSRSDEDRLATAPARLVAEDPTVRLERRPDTGQLLLWCVGEAHAEVLLERLRTRHGVAVNTVPVRVPMVETLAGPVRVTGRHVKQSGGPGPDGVVLVKGEPAPQGAGIG